MSTTSDEGFLARWSRLKRRPAEADEMEAGADAQVPPPNDEERQLAMRSGREGKVDRACPPEGAEGEGGEVGGERKFRDFSDFDFEKLDFDSDYTQFMKDDVSEDARNKALRQLWNSNPVLANMDGLDDYCEDYTDAAMVPIGGIRTAYKIGKGFLSDAEVAEWEALGRPKEAEVATAGTGDDAEAQDAVLANDGTADVGDESMVPEASGAEHAGVAGDAGAPGGDVPDTFAGFDAVGSPGAACAAAVKQDERAALEAYEAEKRATAKDDTAT